jgi:hypothetical protein
MASMLLPRKNELVKLPDQEAGIALVFRIFDRVSYALVMSASKNIRSFSVLVIRSVAGSPSSRITLSAIYSAS